MAHGYSRNCPLKMTLWGNKCKWGRACVCVAGVSGEKNNENQEKDLLHARDGVVLRPHLAPQTTGHYTVQLNFEI